MEEKLIQLIEKINNDKDLKEKMMRAETAGELQTVLGEIGIELGAEHIEEFKNKLVGSIDKEESEELSDDELDKVSGGLNANPIHMRPAQREAASVSTTPCRKIKS